MEPDRSALKALADVVAAAVLMKWSFMDSRRYVYACACVSVFITGSGARILFLGVTRLNIAAAGAQAPTFLSQLVFTDL